MSLINIQASIERACKRFEARPSPRKRRRDRGKFRLSPGVKAPLDELLLAQDRPPMRSLLSELELHCCAQGIKRPSRATVYHYMARGLVRPVPIAELPKAARATLYNLPRVGTVPGHQLVFYCFNYGDTDAISYAAGRPWLDIYQALRMRGWRPKSRALLAAIARARGI